MPIRPALYADLLPAAECLANAFHDEDLFGNYIHPYRKQYPEDMYLYFLHMLRMAYVSGPQSQLLVSYHRDKSGKETAINGIAHWTRSTSPPQQPSWYTRTLKSAMSWYNYLESFVFPNRALDPSRAGISQQFEPFCAHFWTGTRADVWNLKLLGVDPSASGKGYGKALVKWGFDKAKAEGVGCSVVSSAGNESFYRHCGFDKLVGGASDEGGNENPLVREKISGGAILFWDNGRSLEGLKRYGEA